MDHLDEIEEQSILEEIRIMKKIGHPFIVKLIDNFIDNLGHMCMV